MLLLSLIDRYTSLLKARNNNWNNEQILSNISFIERSKKTQHIPLIRPLITDSLNENHMKCQDTLHKFHTTSDLHIDDWK